jgi:hypothetical protein
MTESHKNELCTYSLGNVGELYDYTAIEEITGLNKTKLHRVMVKECLKPAHIYNWCLKTGILRLTELLIYIPSNQTA